MASDNATFPGLLGDWGRVLTSDVFASFGAFCELEGLEPDATSRVFGNDAECRDSCRTPGVRRATPGDVLAELFDAVVISGEVGLRKPHRDIYALRRRTHRARAGRLRVRRRPRDQSGFGGEAWDGAVHHRAADETIAQLERLFGVSLR